MDQSARYALYVVPEGPLYELGAAWLGWDVVSGCPLPHPNLNTIGEPVERLTRRPRKYGFHGTIKPPFALKPGTDPPALQDAVGEYCKTRSPVSVPQMVIRTLGRFVAIVPDTPSADLSNLASTAVEELDGYRAQLTEADLARRRKRNLSARQEELLSRWGYPYVMEEFRFHLTLTGPTDDASSIAKALETHFAAALKEPFVVNSLCLMVEEEAGFFRLVRRYPFGG